ncbi:hypothetical protein B0O80DRAFT_141836 [Mortierella sp. GBAus27b]|nr:hypothetical protein B0O80DRAFT_141836 [Mortierella sp. GBAus27b]
MQRMFSLSLNLALSKSGTSPRLRMFRKHDVDSHVEMEYTFHAAGSTSVHVHMSDIISGKMNTQGFKEIAACGGFSHGDVIGAGSG